MRKLVYKKWAITVVTLNIFLVAGIIWVNYLIDPLQFYRKAFYPPVFSEEQRYQLPGLAKNYDYDSIIIGSSMTENFIPSYIKQRLGLNVLKLSISGASAKEQYMIAKLAIQTGKVKNIIWGVDYFALRGTPDRVRDEQGQFPFYLYDDNSVNDLKYLINYDTAITSLKILSGLVFNKKKDTTDLDLLYTWNDKYQFGPDFIAKEWVKLNTSEVIVSQEYELGNIEQNLQKNVFELVRENTNIKFYIYYPPYSIFQHYYFYKKNHSLFENELYVKEYIYDEIGSLNNVEIFDFQHEEKITFNLNLYKDLAHHSQEINEFIIDSISNNDYRVTQENINDFITILKNQVLTFKPENLIKITNG